LGNLFDEDARTSRVGALDGAGGGVIGEPDTGGRGAGASLALRDVAQRVVAIWRWRTISARPSIKDIGPSGRIASSDECVAAAGPKESVIAVVPNNRVVVGTTAKRIIPGTPVQGIIS
jgi:hypothetical protein